MSMTADELVSRLATEIESLQKQLAEMKDEKNGTITERLAAVGIQVKPLVWRHDERPHLIPRWNSYWHGTIYEVVKHGRMDARGDYSAIVYILQNKEIAVGTAEHCLAVCDAHHAEAVMKLLEII